MHPIFKRKTCLMAPFIACLFLALPVSARSPLFRYHFADAQEGLSCLLSHEAYFGAFNQNDLDFRLQKKGSTLEEWKEFAAGQLLDFTEEEKTLIREGMEKIEDIIAREGYHLPELGEITFIMTTMQEEEDAGAYTHGMEIYLCEEITYMLRSEDKILQVEGLLTLAHELFHCLTRFDPAFRASMYSIIGFTIQEEDFDFPPEILERMISNPDVEHRNSYASFTIDGKATPCTVIFYVENDFEEGDDFFITGRTGLVPIDDLSRLIDSSEVPDFWTVFGSNTVYVIDPEEAIADNFSLALIDDPDRIYPSPEIIEEIQAMLKQ